VLRDRIVPASTLPALVGPLPASSSLDAAADVLLAALADAHAAARRESVELPAAFRELVTWALRRRVQLAAEQAFDQLNPDFGIAADASSPTGQRAVQTREAALALGTRAAVTRS
jgi:hypothetical protein